MWFIVLIFLQDFSEKNILPSIDGIFFFLNCKPNIKNNNLLD